MAVRKVGVELTIENERAYVKSLEQAEKAANDVAKSVEALAEKSQRSFTDAEKATDKVAEALKDVEKEADKAAKSVEDAFDDADKKTKGFGISLDDLKSGLGSVGTVAASAAAGGILAFGVGLTAIVTNAENVDKIVTRMNAQIGASAVQSDIFREQALDVYASGIATSFEDAASSIALVENQLQLIGDEAVSSLSDAAENSIKLRDTFGTDQIKVLNAVNELMVRFGLTSKEAFDFITLGFQNGLNASDDFLDTITEYSNQFAQTDATAQEFFSVLSSGLAGGVLGTDKAADLIKEFNIRFLEGNDEVKASFAALGLSYTFYAEQVNSGSMRVIDVFEIVNNKLNENEDVTKRQTTAVALMGTQFEDLTADVVQFITTQNTALEQSEGTTASLSTQYENLGSAATRIWRSIEIALLPVGDALLKIANQYGPQLEAFFTQLEPTIKQVADTLVGLVNGDIDLTNLFNSSEFGKTFNELWPKIQAVIDENLPKILETASLIFGKLSEVVTIAVDKIKEVVERVLPGIQEFWDTHGHNIERIVTTTFDNVLKIIEGVITLAVGVIKLGLGLITLDADLFFSGLEDTFEGGFTVIGAIVDQVKNIFDPLGLAYDEAGMSTVEWLLEMQQWLSELPVIFLNWLGTTVETVSLMSADLLAKGILLASNFIQGIVEGISNMAADAIGAIFNLGNRMEYALNSSLEIRSPSRVTYRVGDNTVQGLVDGILDRTPDAILAIDNLGRGLDDASQRIADRLKKTLRDGVEDSLAAVASLFRQTADIQDITAGFAPDTKQIDKVKEQIKKLEAERQEAQNEINKIEKQAQETLARNEERSAERDVERRGITSQITDLQAEMAVETNNAKQLQNERELLQLRQQLQKLNEAEAKDAASYNSLLENRNKLTTDIDSITKSIADQNIQLQQSTILLNQQQNLALQYERRIKTVQEEAAELAKYNAEAAAFFLQNQIKLQEELFEAEEAVLLAQNETDRQRAQSQLDLLRGAVSLEEQLIRQNANEMIVEQTKNTQVNDMLKDLFNSVASQSRTEDNSNTTNNSMTTVNISGTELTLSQLADMVRGIVNNSVGVGTLRRT